MLTTEGSEEWLKGREVKMDKGRVKRRGRARERERLGHLKRKGKRRRNGE